MQQERKTASVIHVVQRLSPGGIETLVLELVRSGNGDAVVFSLEGTIEDLISGWPALEPMRDRIETFNKKPGIQPLLPFKLAARFRQLRPNAVILHHIGPLIYGGGAARLAKVPRV